MVLVRLKEPVHIRRKRLKDGNISLYLDIYFGGRRAYEFLGLYLVPELDKNAKLRNKETLRLAEAIKSQRIVEIQNGMYGFNKHNSKTRLVAYIESFIESKGKGTRKMYRNVAIRVREFFGENFLVDRLSSNDVRNFFRHLRKTSNHNYKGKTLSQTTLHSYCNIFKTFVHQAIKDGLLANDVTAGIDVVGVSESVRQYLTLEELQSLAQTELNKEYKRAFLFSCFTGLRKSDIEQLQWSDIIEQDGFTRIVFRQRKTRNIEYLDISQQAKQIIGERDKDSEKVFPKFKYSAYTNKALRKWAKTVGINKDITFHSARHTFAVMMLTLGVDIYTTSKLLGHRELSTTQIYAKIVDKKKQDAVSKIPIIIKNPAL
jgi:integrase